MWYGKRGMKKILHLVNGRILRRMHGGTVRFRQEVIISKIYMIQSHAYALKAIPNELLNLAI